MNRRIQITIEYDGTSYHGWQRQRDIPTIQKCLEDALKTLRQSYIPVIASGRTDAGVHALGQVAHFDIDFVGSDEELRKAINRLMPHDIYVRQLKTVESSFHAQKCATGKIYLYRIWNSPEPSVFQLRHYWWIPTPLDLSLMEEAAQYCLGTHDFSSFQNVGTPVLSTMRTLKKIACSRPNDPEIHWEFEADGFLKQMVRNIMGTLVAVGKRRFPPSQVKELLTARNRSYTPPPAPAHGLTLKEVKY